MNLRRALLVIDPPAAWTTCDEALQGLRELALQSDHALLCFPRVQAFDRLRGRYEPFGNGGAVAGALARVERAERVLEDGLHLLTEPRQRPSLQPGDVAAVDLDGALADGPLELACCGGRVGERQVRGGLQAIPKGQHEGAMALGLGKAQALGLIILPQALKIVIPPLVGIFIAMFKDTSLVVVIGIYDLTQAAKAALVDQAWRGFSAELYIFIAILYFVFCYSMSKYSQSLEKRLATGYKR